MTEPGLRERKKLRTHRAISEAAINLFLSFGFDKVSVAQIADAAEVSKRTLFKYFPTKEDLVLDRFIDHIDEYAAVVGARSPEQSPLAALHAWVLAGLADRTPTTGLSDHPSVLTFYRLVLDTPSLSSRLRDYTLRGVDALTEALRVAKPAEDELTARIAATQVVAVLQALAESNWRTLLNGTSAEAHYPTAKRATERAFALLENGIAEQYG
ncbi:MAG TPA: TetR family transcriptional regulator [Pseudonocardiaceae bacterium]|jgi:AcrR family transcriptional regulator